MIYIIVSTGIGACLIANHKAYRGATGQAGELGHVMVERDGQVCACGKRGCLEAVAAVPAMLSMPECLVAAKWFFQGCGVFGIFHFGFRTRGSVGAGYH